MSKSREDRAVVAMVKAALEFNSGIVALCTSYFGQLDRTSTGIRFTKEYRRMVKNYEKELTRIVDDVHPISSTEKK